MLPPIESLTIYKTAFGGELELFWKPRSDHEETILIFRSESPINEASISTFLSSGTLANNIKLFNIQANYNAFVDTELEDGKTYYYCVVAKKDNELSNYLYIQGSPEKKLKFNVKDGKDIVAKAIKIMFNNILVDGKRINVGSDIKIVKNFSLEPIGENWLMLERINGATMYKFWANEIANIKNVGKIKGDIDVDVIRGTFITINSSERRDLVYNMFRANKQVLIKIIKRLGAINCDITLEGDYYNPAVHGVNATGFVILFNMLVENITLIPEENLINIFEEIKVG